VKVNWKLGDTQLILKECRKAGLSDEHTAYVLATAYHETAHTMKPVREAYWLSESWRKGNLRYWPWYGRGYVQLTWERNYEYAGAVLGLDLTTDPDVVMKPKVSAKILVRGMKEGWFTGKSMGYYSTFAQMRRVVNGTDKAALIAGHADDYLAEMPRSTGFDWAALLRFIMGMFKK
jgi:hypothetical protein